MHFSCGVSGERGYEKSFLQMAFSELVVHSGPLLADAVHEIMQFLVGGNCAHAFRLSRSSNSISST